MSVRVSHADIVPKRRKLGYCGFHQLIAQALYFCEVSCMQVFVREHPKCSGRVSRVGEIAIFGFTWAYIQNGGIRNHNYYC